MAAAPRPPRPPGSGPRPAAARGPPALTPLPGSRRAPRHGGSSSLTRRFRTPGEHRGGAAAAHWSRPRRPGCDSAPPPRHTRTRALGCSLGLSFTGALEETQAAAPPEAPDEDEDEEEMLPHSEAVDVFQEGLAMVVQDPLLCDLPIQVTLEEVNSQIALEYGQAMTVRVCKMDGEVMPVVVVQSATVLDLKKAIQRHVQLRQEREGGIQHISWAYVWRTYHLTSAGEKLTEDRKKLRDYGIRNRDEVSFIKKLRQK
ncbi:U11/U12 small nuclear ribonucleoprotein 25 kDa protein [Sorex fumeus]|uniref:U11/U12 small nuclear ribonucleoprotein 25 kDa protein n=2 Tax=Sorex TaxID=9379 RepID=UPI0024AE0065|nr:U11/U12 small nuclear ribonucleoprotein 25 kDa protein [Sorex fumeus]